MESTIDIESTPERLRCVGKVQYPLHLIVRSGAAIVASAVPLLFAVSAFNKYLINPNKTELLVEIAIYFVPLLLVGCVLIGMFRRHRRTRGLTIEDATVTLFTPDDAIQQHRFDLSYLGGASLVAAAGMVDVEIQRRNGRPVRILRGHSAASLAAVVDQVNARVIANRSHAFEVIPLATPISRQPLQVKPPDRL